MELPTPDLLASLHMDRGQTLHLASCDISQYYNRLRAPPFLIPFLGLPKIRSSKLCLATDSEFVVPCLRCIPMGATFAVGLAQTVSTAIIRRSGLLPSLLTTAGSRTIPKRVGTVIVYIDDVSVVLFAPLLTAPTIHAHGSSKNSPDMLYPMRGTSDK